MLQLLEGGVTRLHTKFYEKNHCTPGTTNHDGGDERFYRLSLPDGDTMAVVTLESPCANLDLAAFKWNGDDCPSGDTSVSRCEMWPKDGTKSEQVKLTNRGKADWLLVVEGQDEEEGAFSLSVECRPGLN